ncbi:MAG: YdeI/OmpD-associated family protein [Rhodobacteraceae bacterium]|nr:YdeI/OmpD-associated family protein [Paracoccaceae bacterium]
MPRPLDDAPRIEVRSRAELRAFLAAHHATGVTCWLVTWRRHRPEHLAYSEIVEELLCWGWIDSLPRALDADRTMLMIAPRRDGSAWSAANKAHAERAIVSGAMTPAGLARIEAAKANGRWTFLDDVERLEVPADLATAFTVGARAVWDAFPRSIQRAALEWLKTAKGADTRASRVAEIAGSAAAGLRPRPFRRR